MKRPLLLLGYATCQLPLAVAVSVGWWTAWVGMTAGIAVSIVCGVLWSRRAGRLLPLAGILVGLAFSVMGASLFLPTLRLLLGALPTYQLGTPYQLEGTTPMEVEFVSVEGGAPRTDLLHMGPVHRTRSEAGTSYLYSVVAPLVPPDWQKSERVPAWAICEVSRESTGQQESAESECAQLLAREDANYEREGFDADVPNAPMVDKAMAQHDLTQANDAPVCVLHLAEDAWLGIIMPLLVLLLTIGPVTTFVKKHLEGGGDPTLGGDSKGAAPS